MCTEMTIHIMPNIRYKEISFLQGLGVTQKKTKGFKVTVQVSTQYETRATHDV